MVGIKLFLGLLLLGIMFIVSSQVEARVTPEDIVNTKKAAYEEKVIQYSSENQAKLKALNEKISEINKRRTAQLDNLMITQALILDEYESRTFFSNENESLTRFFSNENEKRQGEKKKAEIEKARYWITYAHEAVAYQAAKIYVFNLTKELNIRSDVSSTVSLFQSDLNSTRTKVINSQKILEGVISFAK